MERIFKARPSSLGKIMGNAKVKGELPETAKTYLVEWVTNSFEDVQSKYMTKGILMENEAIDFMATQLGLGIAEKNINIFSNDYLVGTPDVITEDLVIDLKCSWNQKTLNESALKLNKDYEWQLRAYMMLTNIDNSILFYALMDTPSEANYGKAVSFSHLSEKERWTAFKITRDLAIEQEIIDRVLLCRKWLDEYETEIKKKLGTIQL